jgi:uncharacterized membrane protein YhaH (DUF805 family)
LSWYLIAWQRAADFSGRSRRKEYWIFHLFNAIVALALVLAAVPFSDKDKPGAIALALLSVYCLVVLVPSLSITIRRLHDIGKSGWWYFVGFVPLIGGIILFVFSVLDSEPGANQWGVDPKASERVQIPPPYPTYR